jgi:hypothetical protein
LKKPILAQGESEALQDLKLSLPSDRTKIEKATKDPEKLEPFHYAMDTLCDYESAFPQFNGDDPETRKESTWYYLLFDKYVLAKDKWTFQSLLEITCMCTRVFGNTKYWRERFGLELKKKDPEYKFSCSYCLLLCRLLIPPNNYSSPTTLRDVVFAKDVTECATVYAVRLIPKETARVQVTRKLSESYFTRCSSKQTPLVNALFSPMGFKRFFDGIPQLCPSTSPHFNHRNHLTSKTKQIMEETIQNEQPEYTLNGAYYIADFVLGEAGETTRKETRGRRREMTPFPILVDYSEASGQPLVGDPIAIPTAAKHKDEVMYLRHMMLERVGGKGYRSGKKPRGIELKRMVDLEPAHDDPKAKITAMMPSIQITEMFSLCKLELDSFLADYLTEGTNITDLLFKLQVYIKDYAPYMKNLFPHVPVLNDQGYEELPLIFHQTRFLLQSISTLRNGALEGFHRLHAAVSALTNYPYGTVMNDTNPFQTTTPSFINSKLFFQRADCTHVIPYYQNDRFYLQKYSAKVSEEKIPNFAGPWSEIQNWRTCCSRIFNSVYQDVKFKIGA